MTPAVTLTLLGLSAVASTVVAMRLAARRWVQWAALAADAGTSAILQATGIDSEDAVSDLRARYEAWRQIVAASASRFCRTEDAMSLLYFNVPASVCTKAFDEEHRVIVDAAAERIRRLRRLADRLERGETRLRLRWVPRVS